MIHADPDWLNRYADRFTSAEVAVAAIEPGRPIFVGSGAAVPMSLVDALVACGGHLHNNPIVHLLTLGPAPYVAADMQERFRHTAFFIGPNTREAVQEGRADFMPVFLSEIPQLIASRRLRIDVALIQVSPPDRHGYLSLGVAVDVVRSALEYADLVIAEVNPQMPRTLGDSVVHIDRIDHLVAVDRPLPELAAGTLDEVALGIGRNVAALIPDGATLQMGIGKIPDAVLASIDDRRDLGIHTEMFSDGVMRLVEAGIINGRRKTLLPGKLVTSFVLGSQKLYEWMHDNPAVEMRPSEFTNDPFIIARNDRMIAINSAINVDLTGQVAADTLMGRFFSGIGGQVDFIRGASRARHGKPIIALPSTAKDGAISRILPVLEEGAGMVTSRGDVHYVVTEHGVADLWGRSIRERAMALIEVAHPDFRGELLAAAKARRYVFVGQQVPRGRTPAQPLKTTTLPDGRRVWLRDLNDHDSEHLRILVEQLADPGLAKAFLGENGHQAAAGRTPIAALMSSQGYGVVALDEHGDGPEAYVAFGRFDMDPATRMADFLVMTHPAWRGQQLGTLLLGRLHDTARARGLSGLRARFAAGNKAILSLLYDSKLPFTGKLRDGSWRLKVRFDKGRPGDAKERLRTTGPIPSPVERLRSASAPTDGDSP